MKTCYHYSSKTFEYLYSEDIEADVRGEYYLPPNSTWVAPPEIEEYQIQIFNTTNETWSIEKDYRRKFDNHGIGYGGKPFYYNSQYWWGNPTYTFAIGDIPEGTSFSKIEKPEMASQCKALTEERANGKAYLDATDKNWIELQAYKNGYRKYLTEEEVAKMETIEVERDRIATLINSHKSEMENLQAEIVKQYGEEALNHL